MRIKHFFREYIFFIALLVAAVFVGHFLTHLSEWRSSITNASEDVLMIMDGTAVRAVAFGDRHFDAKDTALYDLTRAEYWYRRALALDRAHPLVEHQLARIAFLEGNFYLALSRISREIQTNPHPSPSSYYVKGLIEGYMGLYAESVADYRVYIAHDPYNWAATNDLAWVLIQDNRPQEALEAIDAILGSWPQNPWLYNMRATALSLLERFAEARESAHRAGVLVVAVTPDKWSIAYPGNDPLIAAAGLAVLQQAVFDNMHTVDMQYAGARK